MNMRVRRWMIRGLVLVGSSLLTFAMLEAGFRLLESLRLGAAGELWAIYDETLGYRNNPVFGDHNAEGFRDRQLTPKAGRFRVVVLGDSVAYYGDDLEDTFPGRLRAQLNRSYDDEHFDVVNTSVRGWTNWQEVQFLESEVDELEPDLVLVAFVLNDCHRILHAFRIDDGRIVGQGFDFDPAVVAQVDSWIYRTLRRSRLLVWVRRELIHVDADAIGVSNAYSFEYRPDFRTAWLDEPWREVEDQLGRLRALGRQRGFRVVLVVFPFGDQYRLDYLHRDREYVLKPQRQLAGIGARLDIPVVDLYTELDPSVDLMADGIHLTDVGRRHVAAHLEEFLTRTQLLSMAQ